MFSLWQVFSLGDAMTRIPWEGTSVSFDTFNISILLVSSWWTSRTCHVVDCLSKAIRRIEMLPTSGRGSNISSETHQKKYRGHMRYTMLLNIIMWWPSPVVPCTGRMHNTNSDPHLEIGKCLYQNIMCRPMRLRGNKIQTPVPTLRISFCDSSMGDLQMQTSRHKKNMYRHYQQPSLWLKMTVLRFINSKWKTCNSQNYLLWMQYYLLIEKQVLVGKRHWLLFFYNETQLWGFDLQNSLKWKSIVEANYMYNPVCAFSESIPDTRIL